MSTARFAIWVFAMWAVAPIQMLAAILQWPWLQILSFACLTYCLVDVVLME